MMIIRKSLLRLLRTPVRTILFFLLVGFASALLATGGGLWHMCPEGRADLQCEFAPLRKYIPDHRHGGAEAGAVCER